MKFLIDTHIFLWWITDAPQLPPYIRRIIGSGDTELFLSAVSCWEIAIKAQIGRIDLPDKPGIFISHQMSLNAIQGLPIQTSHALQIFNLPIHHRDPFDRIIIAQSQLEKLPIITSDPLIAKYKVKVVWKKQ